MFENSETNTNEKATFSVSEISAKVKDLLETNFNHIRVKGEISGLKIATSGHGYFNLKDNFAVLACTCWRPVLSKIQFNLIDGIEVIISGRMTSYGGQSRYQLTVERIEPAGIGAMMQILQERKIRLEKEGLFDISTKQALPFLPNIIGVITSITGAVIRDIIHRITDRHPTNIIIWPVTVQGENAADE
ncbi:MAG: exodeoxyribonuclease VII large subunit, partial [Janthinobacterium lividum]